MHVDKLCKAQNCLPKQIFYCIEEHTRVWVAGPTAGFQGVFLAGFDQLSMLTSEMLLENSHPFWALQVQC